MIDRLRIPTAPHAAPRPVALPDRLLAAADALNAAAVADEHRDPFWSDRYGERGHRFMLSDGVHHFNYLAEALRAGSTHVLEKYARWLRSVLVTRGMCSEHLADGLRIRARHITALGWPDTRPAVDALHAAAASLAYTTPPAAGLVLAQSDPLPPACAVLTRHLAVDAVHHDARHLLSYLADALALDRPDLLRDHLAWRVGFERRRGRRDTYLPALLAALVDHTSSAPPAQALLRAAAEVTP
jgi:hypothetical protein